MEINHRHTRTGFARPLAAPSGLGLRPRATRPLCGGRISARPYLERRKRKRGASACPPKPLVLRSLGEGGWRRWVLVCGSENISGHCAKRYYAIWHNEELRETRAACGASVLVGGSKEIAVRAGTGQFKDEDVLVNLVDEQPVGRDMAFTMIGPVVCGVLQACSPF